MKINVIILIIAVNIVFVCQAEDWDIKAPDGLRGVYLSKIDKVAGSPMVGRLALELFKNNQYHEVRLDHIFRSGDRFRFKVSTSLSGWLYIFHRPHKGEPQLLWPQQKNNERKSDINYIKAKTMYSIPPSPGILVFDEEVGEESFYVVIRSKPIPPALKTLRKSDQEPNRRKKTLVAPEQPRQRIVQFSVRAPNIVDDRPSRGVIFDPGTRDSDPYIYFTSSSEDNDTSALIEFQLNHIGP